MPTGGAVGFLAQDAARHWSVLHLSVRRGALERGQALSGFRGRYSSGRPLPRDAGVEAREEHEFYATVHQLVRDAEAAEPPGTDALVELQDRLTALAKAWMRPEQHAKFEAEIQQLAAR